MTFHLNFEESVAEDLRVTLRGLPSETKIVKWNFELIPRRISFYILGSALEF